VRRGVVGVAHRTKVAQHIRSTSKKNFNPEPEGVFPKILFKHQTIITASSHLMFLFTILIQGVKLIAQISFFL
jgi:hypothetical protein